MKKTFLLLLLSQVVLGAQAPATVHAVWTPNAVTDNITQYTLTLDGGTPLVVLPTICSPTLCSQIVTVPAFGSHTLVLAAWNLKLSTDPTSLQSGPPVNINFTLGSVPAVMAGVRVIN